jgi:hypothetical protein
MLGEASEIPGKELSFLFNRYVTTELHYAETWYNTCKSPGPVGSDEFHKLSGLTGLLPAVKGFLEITPTEFEGFPMRKDFPKQGDKYIREEEE